jgi:hypothetical protein
MPSPPPRERAAAVAWAGRVSNRDTPGGKGILMAGTPNGWKIFCF